MRSVTLSNGMKIVQINQHETKFLYEEIFVQELYGSRGIDIRPGDVVMDIGANIGLFALYMNERFSPGQIFCFEPAPHCLEALKINVAHLKDKVIVSNAAVGNCEGEAEFTYYPNYTIMSSMVADKERDNEVLKAGARTQFQRQFGNDADERTVEFLVGKKLDGAQTFKCPVTTLSNVIDTYRLKRISLAKIDVECAENAVLAGIREEHWPMIDQLVVEVHNQGAKEHEMMRDQLKNRGYRVELLAESNLQNSGIFEIIARR